MDQAKPQNKECCPCAKLLFSQECEKAISDAYHELSNRCQTLMAKDGDMRGIRRIFYKCYYPDSWVGSFINWFTNGESVSHVSFIFPRPADLGKMILWEIEADGRRGVIGHEHGISERDGYYRYIDVTLEDYRTMMGAALSLVGKEYDKPGILGFVTRSRKEDPDKWFCSELLSFILRKGNNPISRKPDYKVTPNDCWATMVGKPCSKDEVHV